MIGIGLIIFILIWGSIAVWLGRLLSRIVFARFTSNANTGQPSTKGSLITFLLIVFVFLLPIADEIISYPSYYKLCEDGGKYEFALGMDEKKAFGRQHQVKLETKLMRLFPDFHILSSSEDARSGVVIQLTKRKVIDIVTNEVILTSDDVVPIHSFFAIPWDGGRIPWVLQECSANVGKNARVSQELLRKLRLD
jgi:hypothetical protein